jgi:nucleoside-triphosphatase THEP1
VLLTGERGVGKSTAIRKVTDRLAALGVDVGGFKTVAGPEDESGLDMIYIMPYGENTDDPSAFSRERAVAVRDRRRARHESRAEVFDGLGAELLRRAPRDGLIVMDELGFMEAGARAFRDAVLSILDGRTPALGVIKPPRFDARAPFLAEARAHGRVSVFEVTAGNRDEAPELLFSHFAAILKL